jgi:hypothetical protein
MLQMNFVIGFGLTPFCVTMADKNRVTTFAKFSNNLEWLKPKVDIPNSNIATILKLSYEWCVVDCMSKNGH